MKYSAYYHVFPDTFHVISLKVNFHSDNHTCSAGQSSMTWSLSASLRHSTPGSCNTRTMIATYCKADRTTLTQERLYGQSELPDRAAHWLKGNRFSLYNMKCSGENVLLRGIFHIVSRFPLHFMLYRGHLDYFLNSAEQTRSHIVESTTTCPLGSKFTIIHITQRL